MNETFKKMVCAVLTALLTSIYGVAQPAQNLIFTTDSTFFTTDEARRIGNQILIYQRCTGGWPKNIDMTTPLNDAECAVVLAQKSRRYDSTTDNNATTTQMTFLARLYQATHEAKYRDAFLAGVQYLLDGQYAHGGWPQFWPEMSGYQTHITFNDDAMVNTMLLLREMIKKRHPYGGDLLDDTLRATLQEAFDKGVACIIATQIRVDGVPTVWCQQHDRETLAPAKARAYELPSFCSQESVSIVKLLMKIPHPSAEIQNAIHGAMAWFEKYKITGFRIVREFNSKGKVSHVELVADPQATPIWARYYDLERCEPFVCDRDGVPRQSIDELGEERRNGYSWYNDKALELFPLYEAWKNRWNATAQP